MHNFCNRHCEDHIYFCETIFRISGKGVHKYKGMGVRFSDFISFFLNIP